MCDDFIREKVIINIYWRHVMLCQPGWDCGIGTQNVRNFIYSTKGEFFINIIMFTATSGATLRPMNE